MCKREKNFIYIRFSSDRNIFVDVIKVYDSEKTKSQMLNIMTVVVFINKIVEI